MADSTKVIAHDFNEIQEMKYGAKFFKADLHFHTPASEDARGKNRYNFNPYKKKYPRNRHAPNYADQLKAIQETILNKASRLAIRIVQQFLKKDLSLVAVTDHNSLGTIWSDDESEGKLMDLAAPTWYELIEQQAQVVNDQAGKTLITILPGVEISTTGIHILAIFPPSQPRRKVHFVISDLLNEVGFAIDDWGKNPKVGKVSAFETIDLIVKKGGIAIPAHIDGSDQALLNLYKLNSGAMKNVLTHEKLGAVEIVTPSRFTRKDRKLGMPLKQWIDSLRGRQELKHLAFFQGSDAHDITNVAKRYSHVKMTSPSFSGLRTAIQMPSSRVRISTIHTPPNEGLFVHSIVAAKTLLGSQTIRLNRHLNCISGKKGTGKSFLNHLMQCAVNKELPLAKGSVRLIVERIVDGTSEFYAFCRDAEKPEVSLFRIDQNPFSVDKIHIDQASNLNIIPKFYKPYRIEEIINSPEELNAFLVRHFGNPTKTNIEKFNKLFDIDSFLTEKEPLLYVKAKNQMYQLSLNVNWRNGKQKFRYFYQVSDSLKRMILLSMIVIGRDFGPKIIDAPEAYFDNEDIAEFLLPVIKQYKDFQQLIVFTNHPIWAINTDPDNYVLLNPNKMVQSGFAIDDTDQKSKLISIIEGSLKSFRKRSVRYEVDRIRN